MTDTERANLVNDIAVLLDLQAAAPPIAPPTRFKTRYGVCYCMTCGLSVLYCKGHTPDGGVPSADNGAADSLQSRINECAKESK
jgi:hypothetical protein